MSERVTRRDLELMCDMINDRLGRPLNPWGGDPMRANVGTFYVHQQSGGVNLRRMVNEQGGSSAPIGEAYVTKRELAMRMEGMLAGLREVA